ncbi:MAG: beta-eliminating lyase-related protein [Atopobiaceae bacterium]|jgi:threonine aldolase|nr:beta-eliminating lyase-related protein [Atopobiaceae bacterium]
MRTFRNDYSEGAAPAILRALVETNAEQTPGYTEDSHCAHARELIREAVGRDDVAVEFCVGGTSANIVGVTGMLHDWEGVICTPDAHIATHETGAVAACGRTVLPTADEDGFLSPEEAERVWARQTSCGRHMTRPALVYISDTTELGGVWSRSAFDAVCDWARARGLGVFVDGARLGSALTSDGNDLSLEHVAARASAFTLGGTKNGMLFGEAMVIADPRLRHAFPYLVKERGGLIAKGRLVGVQYEAALSGGLYWKLAAHANECACALRDGLVGLGYKPYLAGSSNQQFFVFTNDMAQRLERAVGCETWCDLDRGHKVVRFVCSWATTHGDVDELLAYVGSLS